MKQQSTPFEFNPSTGQRIMLSMARTAESYRQRYPLGTWRYNPWTGTLRDGRDIANDQTGLLIVPPGEELVAASDSGWHQVNGNPFSPVAGDVLVDVRILGDAGRTECVPAGDVQWSRVAAYRVSDVKPQKQHIDKTPEQERAMFAPTAPDLLDAAAGHMRDRAATYDKPEGERSMGKTVQAFNTITGRDDSAITCVISKLIATLAVLKTEGQFVNHETLIEMLEGCEVILSNAPSARLRESEGWLLMALLKMVRSEQRDQPHRDSIEDLIAYAALFGESRVGGW